MSGFPLLLIPLAICNIIVFLMPGVAFDTPLFTLPLASKASWVVTLSDALVSLGLLLLLLEVLKSARAGGKYFTDHLLALLIFAGAAAEFVLLPQFANATFFLLTLITLVDFLSGIGLRAGRPRRVRETVLADPVVVREPPRDPVYEPVREPVREPLREPIVERPLVTPPPATSLAAAQSDIAAHPGERISPSERIDMTNAGVPRVEPIIDTVGPDETEPKRPLPPPA